MIYDWLRAVHIISVLAWVAALFCFAFMLTLRASQDDHGDVASSYDAALFFLRKHIVSHTMHVAWIAGLALSWFNWEVLNAKPWYWGKITLIILTTIAHWRLTVIQRLLTTPLDQRPDRNYTNCLRALSVLIPMSILGGVLLVVLEPWS